MQFTMAARSLCFCDSTAKKQTPRENKTKTNTQNRNKTTTTATTAFCIKHNNVMYIKMKFLLVTRKRPNDKTNECIMRLPSLDFYLWFDLVQKEIALLFSKDRLRSFEARSITSCLTVFREWNKTLFFTIRFKPIVKGFIESFNTNAINALVWLKTKMRKKNRIQK